MWEEVQNEAVLKEPHATDAWNSTAACTILPRSGRKARYRKYVKVNGLISYAMTPTSE